MKLCSVNFGATWCVVTYCMLKVLQSLSYDKCESPQSVSYVWCVTVCGTLLSWMTLAASKPLPLNPVDSQIWHCWHSVGAALPPQKWENHVGTVAALLWKGSTRPYSRPWQVVAQMCTGWWLRHAEVGLEVWWRWEKWQTFTMTDCMFTPANCSVRNYLLCL